MFPNLSIPLRQAVVTLDLRDNSIASFEESTLDMWSRTTTSYSVYLDDNNFNEGTEVPRGLFETAKELSMRNSNMEELNSANLNEALCNGYQNQILSLSYSITRMQNFPDLSASLCHRDEVNAGEVHMAADGTQEVSYN